MYNDLKARGDLILDGKPIIIKYNFYKTTNDPSGWVRSNTVYINFVLSIYPSTKQYIIEDGIMYLSHWLFLKYLYDTDRDNYADIVTQLQHLEQVPPDDKYLLTSDLPTRLRNTIEKFLLALHNTPTVKSKYIEQTTEVFPIDNYLCELQSGYSFIYTIFNLRLEYAVKGHTLISLLLRTTLGIDHVYVTDDIPMVVTLFRIRHNKHVIFERLDCVNMSAIQWLSNLYRASPIKTSREFNHIVNELNSREKVLYSRIPPSIYDDPSEILNELI